MAKRYTDEELLAGLKYAGGMIYRAAAAMGINPGTITYRMEKSPSFKEKVERIEKEIADAAFWNVAQAIEEGDLDASKWYLSKSAEGRRRGFGAEVRVTGSGGKERRVVVVVRPKSEEPL